MLIKSIYLKTKKLFICVTFMQSVMIFLNKCLCLNMIDEEDNMTDNRKSTIIPTVTSCT